MLNAFSFEAIGGPLDGCRIQLVLEDDVPDVGDAFVIDDGKSGFPCYVVNFDGLSAVYWAPWSGRRPEVRSSSVSATLRMP